MPRPRDPNRDRAFELYRKSGGSLDLVEIASQLNLPPGTIRGWKSKDNWENRLNGTLQKNTERSKHDSRKNKAEKIKAAEAAEQMSVNTELNSNQQLFCLYCAYGDNATAAYQKAHDCSYQTAMVNASRLLRNAKIKAEVDRIKKERLESLFFDEHDIFQWHLDVARANITDYVTFGREEIQAIGAFGPITDKETGEPITKEVNYVKFKESSEVNGHVIKKVKLGKDGASIELYDAMAAMKWLAEHMSLGTAGQQKLAQSIVDAYEWRRSQEKERKGEADAGE